MVYEIQRLKTKNTSDWRLELKLQRAPCTIRVRQHSATTVLLCCCRVHTSLHSPPFFTVSVCAAQRCEADRQRKAAATARVSEVPHSADELETRDQREFNLKRKLPIIWQQLCIKWYPEVNSSLIWSCFAVCVITLQFLFTSTMD